MSIKKTQRDNFKEGKISQSTFLKTFQNEISELVKMGYKPKEIKQYFEDDFGVELDLKKLYNWLQYNKKKIENASPAEAKISEKFEEKEVSEKVSNEDANEDDDEDDFMTNFNKSLDQTKK